MVISWFWLTYFLNIDILFILLSIKSKVLKISTDQSSICNSTLEFAISTLRNPIIGYWLKKVHHPGNSHGCEEKLQTENDKSTVQTHSKGKKFQFFSANLRAFSTSFKLTEKGFHHRRKQRWENPKTISEKTDRRWNCLNLSRCCFSCHFFSGHDIMPCWAEKKTISIMITSFRLNWTPEAEKRDYQPSVHPLKDAKANEMKVN